VFVFSNLNKVYSPKSIQKDEEIDVAKALTAALTRS
jgi:hypothetical protein